MNVARVTAEGFADAILFVTVTIPIGLALIILPFCIEQGPATICNPGWLGGIHDTLFGIALLLSFGGIVFLAPVLGIAGGVSLIAKFRRYIGGDPPRSIRAIVREVITIIPLLAVAYLFYTLFPIL